MFAHINNVDAENLAGKNVRKLLWRKNVWGFTMGEEVRACVRACVCVCKVSASS